MSVWKEQQSDVKGIKKRLPQVIDFATQNLGKRSSKMKEDWKECKLGEVLTIKYGKNQKEVESPNGTIPIYGTGGLMGYATKFLYDKPSILIGRKGTINKVKFIDKPFWTVDTLFYSIINEEIVSPKFLYYQLSLINFMNYNEGTTIPSLRTETLNRIEVSLPPLATQQKIAKILSSLDDKIELNNKINDNLEQQAQAIFKRFLNNSSKLVKFTDVIDILGGGTPKTNNENYWNGDIPFFTPKDVGNPYCLITEKAITKNGLENCNSKLYPVNTIFVTARGTVGKVCLAGLPMAMNQSCYALKGKDNNQLLAYFYTLEVISSLKYKANGATFDAIVTRDFETETITVLSNTDSEKFTYIVESIYEQILFKQQENIRLTQLRDTLLPKLMNGEIDVDEVKV